MSTVLGKNRRIFECIRPWSIPKCDDHEEEDTHISSQRFPCVSQFRGLGIPFCLNRPVRSKSSICWGTPRELREAAQNPIFFARKLEFVLFVYRIFDRFFLLGLGWVRFGLVGLGCPRYAYCLKHRSDLSQTFICCGTVRQLHEAAENKFFCSKTRIFEFWFFASITGFFCSGLVKNGSRCKISSPLLEKPMWTALGEKPSYLRMHSALIHTSMRRSRGVRNTNICSKKLPCVRLHSWPGYYCCLKHKPVRSQTCIRCGTSRITYEAAQNSFFLPKTRIFDILYYAFFTGFFPWVSSLVGLGCRGYAFCLKNRPVLS